MKFSLLFGGAIFAATALAAPRPGALADRIETRATRTRSSHPLVPAGNHDGPLSPDAANIQYSSNWAGAVIESPPAGQTFTAVSATFTVPTPTPPSGAGTGTYSGSAWVGIDGDTYGNAILQTGIDFSVTKSSSGKLSYSYDAWYEWYPNYAFDFSGISIAAGNSISVSVVSSSSSAGTAVIENLSTGQTVSKALTAPSSSSHLGGQNAEWIVEDYESGGTLVPLVSFSPITFTNCVAKTQSSTLGTSGAGIIEIENSSGQVQTTVTIPSSSSVKVTHT